VVLKKITGWFKKKNSDDRTPEVRIPFELPIDEEEIFKKSKFILQQLDEYITSSELESENISIQLDSILEEQDLIKSKIKEVNKPDSWHERNLLLKLDRLVVHGNNLRQRIELYSQNIKVYLNLMAKVEDIRVMRLNGLEADKIETIWLEFQNALESYRQKITTEAVTETKESLTATSTEERLLKLREEVFGPIESEIKEKVIENITPAPARMPIEEALHNQKIEFNLKECTPPEATKEWAASVKKALREQGIGESE